MLLELAVQLAFIGISTRPELHISSLGEDPYFWENWKSILWNSIFLRGIVEWSGYAVIGGLIIGFLISFIYIHFEKFLKLRNMRNENF